MSFFPPTLQDFLSVPHSLLASHLKTHPWNQSLLYHSSFSEQPADKLENSTSTHTQALEKEINPCRAVESVPAPPTEVVKWVGCAQRGSEK